MLRIFPFFYSVQPKNFLLATLALIAVSTSVGASDFKDRKQQRNWMVGAEELLLDTGASSTGPIGGDSRANSDVVPILDVRYFITRGISLETMRGYSKHKLRALGIALGYMSLGTTKILLFSLTAQYNSRANNQISTYVGVGLNYMLFVDVFPGDARDVNYDVGFVPVLTLGLDYFLDDRRFFNIDVKKYSFQLMPELTSA